MSVDLTNPADPVVAAALSRKCQMCKAAPQVRCESITPREFADGRLVHFARIERWDVA